MMCRDGRFPEDFRLPKTIEEVRVIDRKFTGSVASRSSLTQKKATRLERILQAYGLPADLRTLGSRPRDRLSIKHAQMAKLATLFDFLGAMRLSDHLRRRSSLYKSF